MVRKSIKTQMFYTYRDWSVFVVLSWAQKYVHVLLHLFFYIYGIKNCALQKGSIKIIKILNTCNHTSLGLKILESKCYNDNKKWFNLYLKIFIVLFIVIGIRCLMITADELSGNVSIYNSHVIELLDIIQNLCTFIIFVWRKKIKRMLFKRFGCGLLSKARSESYVTSSSFITTTEEIVMQEKMSSSGRARSHTDSTKL
ncbi:uncharacterized protein LOC114945658 [Nylanderia fulva]|uniref:uncharacterized protein LOC114945658 n=1 Tax=Nylanderia fulva TaxID=613905 RepID=UPI0010FBACA3|nr:uncharacterized protein LOC114945658 [Nylanderia fulva]